MSKQVKEARNDLRWQDSALIKLYLDSIRSAIPLAEEQISIMLRLVQSIKIPVTSVLDLGCGDGILGAALQEVFPASKALFLDFAADMLDKAKQRLAASKGECSFMQADYSRPQWVDQLTIKSFDVIVSGYSIHHQLDARKKQLYKEIFELLKPGGIFLNTEHVASRSDFARKLHRDLFTESMYKTELKRVNPRSKEEVAAEYNQRADKENHLLALTENQCAWLREIGFEDVDCYFKFFELAIFGGIKPLN